MTSVRSVRVSAANSLKDKWSIYRSELLRSISALAQEGSSKKNKGGGGLSLLHQDFSHVPDIFSCAPVHHANSGVSDYSV